MKMRVGWRRRVVSTVAVLGIVAFATVGCAALVVTQQPALSKRSAPRTASGSQSDTAPQGRGAAEDLDAKQSDTRRIIAEALQEVSARRGLEPKRAVEGRWVNREQLLEVVARLMEEGVSAEIISANEILLVALGVVPTRFDYLASVRALMGAQLAGLYDPAADTMYLAGDLGLDATAATLSHELVHALQDQYFDLESGLVWEPDKGDQQAALHALAEGDATLAMMAETENASQGLASLMDLAIRMELETSVDTQIVPGIIARSAAATYADGIGFVQVLRARGGWEAVNRAWRNQPVSTEQILHIEKYDSAEQPEKVPVPIAPDSSYGQPLLHDTLGEQGVRLVLEEWMPRRSAIRGASDWAGDRIAVYSQSGTQAVAWRLRYDSPAAAIRGGAAMSRGVLATPGTDATVTARGTDQARRLRTLGWVCRERQTVGPIGLMMDQRELVVVMGPFRRAEGVGAPDSSCIAAKMWAASIFAAQN